MKNVKYIFVVAMALLFNRSSFGQQNVAGTEKRLEARMAERTISAAKKGDLICTDANGKFVLCSGNSDETIEGFTTNVPYVTPNKPATPKAKKDEFNALASVKNGEIKAGDFICPCGEAGKVVKCSQNDNPYAKALEGAAANGQSFKVKVLGPTH